MIDQPPCFALKEDAMKHFYWWLCYCLLAILLIFFLIVGIYLLIISFDLKDPMIVVTLFFSASLMILVSLSLFAGLVIRGIGRLKSGKTAARVSISQ
jgi:hypothetical protein